MSTEYMLSGSLLQLMVLTSPLFPLLSLYLANGLSPPSVCVVLYLKETEATFCPIVILYCVKVLSVLLIR